MVRSQPYREYASNTSQGGRDLHTYTPRSHEELLRSHLKLDAERQATLQQEYERLANESDNLKRELDRAQEDIRKKNNEIAALNDELRNKSKPFASTSNYREPVGESSPQHTPLYAIDGNPATLHEVLNHFTTIIQRHHDLINRKDQQIKELKDKLNQTLQKTLEYREGPAEAYQRQQEALQQQLLYEKNQIRKEYEKSNCILVERKNKLERVVDDLERKKIERSNEIVNLQNELSRKNALANDSNMKLVLDDKKRENEFLQDKLKELENKNAKGETVKNEIKKVIDSKNEVILKLNNVICKIEKQPSCKNLPPKPDPILQKVEEDCLKAISDVKETNNKLNDIVRKLKDHSCKVEGDIREREDVAPDLENVKTQCLLDIDALKTLLKQHDDDIPADSYSPTPLLYEKCDTPCSHFKDCQLLDKPRAVQCSYVPSRCTPVPGPSRSDYFPANQCEACSEVHIASEPTDPPPPECARKYSSPPPEDRSNRRRKMVGEELYYAAPNVTKRRESRQ